MMVYFDMDGVLCDWKKSYEKHCTMPLEIFSKLPKEKRNEIKQSFINYDFFVHMEPITKGLELFKAFSNGGIHVAVLSAYGDVQSEAVQKAKQAWVEKYLGVNIELLLVRKVHEKPNMMKEGFNKHILIDDRADAINAWESAGGIGILFQ